MPVSSKWDVTLVYYLRAHYELPEPLAFTCIIES